MPESPQHFCVTLTYAQRRIVAQMFPELADRLKLEETRPRSIPFTLAELKAINDSARAAVQGASGGLKRSSLARRIAVAVEAFEFRQARSRRLVVEQVFRFRITLIGVQPPIWRFILVKNCTLDKLHEHIQTAMGWTNSHPHQFKIRGRLYGDPMLMEDDFEELGYVDSTRTRLSEVLPTTGKRMKFDYEYDFGDSWRHDVEFGGGAEIPVGSRYPICQAGARACPPEDVGGVRGYEEFLAAMADPSHERHQELSAWIGGSFDPEAFDAKAVTERMRQGLPDWRSEAWI
jgi:hypothetical protein